jgi:fructose-1,6-bisphosphatase/inositol monophosphatase family enzyme
MLAFHRDVMQLMADVAAAEIVPRFRNLAADDVRQKGKPWDLVTTADVIAEQRLSEGLSRIVPGSVVVGEESASEDAEVIDRLKGSAPVWLIDPVDGTNNFVHGQPCFAVVVAFCLEGETRAGWLLDPLSQVVVWAEAEEGARRTTRATEDRLNLSEKRFIDMTGALPFRMKERLLAVQATYGGVPCRFTRLGSAGREYMEMASGGLDFALYGRLKPWDHAAGVLIHEEAGGFGRLRPGEERYRPGEGIIDKTLLLAPTPAVWTALDRLLG